jgi:hypothetical protein
MKQDSIGWDPWWEQAEAERQVCMNLLADGLWAPACFHALQAIEMALKSLARKETTYNDLAEGRYVYLSTLTYAQMAFGGEQQMKHELVYLLYGLSEWHRKPFEGFRDQFKHYDDHDWYEATRYPEYRSAGTWVAMTQWQAGFTEADATALRSLADAVLTIVEERLPVAPPAQQADVDQVSPSADELTT